MVQIGRGASSIAMYRILLLASVVVLPSCGDPGAPTELMTDRPGQRISELTGADEERLATQRRVIEQLVARGPESVSKLEIAAWKLGAIRAVLEGEVFESTQTYELQCMGILLGDAFVAELGFEWVMVEHEYGRDPAVRVPDTSILLFPLTMISKRIERGEAVDVFDLFNWVAATVDELEEEGV